MSLSYAVKLRAFMLGDAGFEGQFFTAVKTTGIFCRPGCTARKPKKENIEFYDTSEDAMRSGYRPCKVCKPLQHLGAVPPEIEKLLELLNDDETASLRDEHLKKLGIQPVTLRRWFIANYGISFHAYKRMIAMNRAFERISKGEPVTAVAFDSGYNSISGFTERFRQLFGNSPTKAVTTGRIIASRIFTPLGPMLAAVATDRLVLLEFADRRKLATQIKRIKKYFNSGISFGEHQLFVRLQKELNEYFSGTRKEFTIPVNPAGTEFQKAAWDALLKVPYGTTRSYSEQAKSIGKPTGARPVAQANGMNAIAVLIPCHRIIGENGKLTGYGGGLWRKAKLLEMEKKVLQANSEAKMGM